MNILIFVSCRSFEISKIQRQGHEKFKQQKSARLELHHRNLKFGCYIVITLISLNGLFFMFTLEFCDPIIFLKFIIILFFLFNCIRFVGSAVFMIVQSLQSIRSFDQSKDTPYVSEAVLEKRDSTISETEKSASQFFV